MEAGLVVNATEFLSQNWAIALYHEFFSELRYISKTHLVSSGQVAEVLELIVKRAAEEKNLDKEFVEGKLSSMDPNVEKYLRVYMEFKIRKHS